MPVMPEPQTPQAAVGPDRFSPGIQARSGRLAGTKDAYGGVVWPIGGNEAAAGPRFDISVGPGGYAWWYCDALSEDGKFGLTVIAFIGSVFSPYYAWSGRRDPINHSAINVALYANTAKQSWTKGRWAMTERSKASVAVDAQNLEIGPSSLHWDGNELVIEVNETSAPVPLPVKGRIRLVPEGITQQIFALDADGHHRWWPIAPTARVEVEMDAPALSWSGTGYFDTNDGEIPLEESFQNWDWSRASLTHGAAVLYDVTRSGGERMSLALKFAPNGDVEAFEPPPSVKLPTTVWRVPRRTQADGGQARVIKTMEDTPFYARSEIETHILGERAHGVHESLSLERFSSEWVKFLLPFRMPREA
jgi:carotenoid 1,2-hydratase